ncbi:hypothetical protein [Sphingobacterium chungjuense]|uniref:hypothetical protein n=1 Tax=Sphingobacterium chungjuense TaxID=2675553 RepID=UPI00140B3830|nr:hypothetical protein [Sphingobacterium chungjuense]
MNISLLPLCFIGVLELFQMLLILAVYVIVFLLLRKVFLWYWKVDQILENQQKQIEQQQTIIDGLAGLYKSLNKPVD